MNDYYKVAFTIDGKAAEYECDILAAVLGESAGFESFDVNPNLVTGYVKKELFDKSTIELSLKTYPFESTIAWKAELVPGEDWNKEWEKNYFKPILIADKCVVHSSFHKDYPKVDYDIVINPKMAFGTGHHETTTLMITQILEADLARKCVLDMGTGTGVLAILCAMRGASYVKGVEIDPMAYENAVENIHVNNVEKTVNLVCGDASSIVDEEASFDYVLANINRNIITADIDKYANSLRSNGLMQLSGFYTEDIPIIEKTAEKYGLIPVKKREKNRWTMSLLMKK